MRRVAVFFVILTAPITLSCGTGLRTFALPPVYREVSATSPGAATTRRRRHKPDAPTALSRLAIAFEHYNERHPHKALKYRSPREFRRAAVSST